MGISMMFPPSTLAEMRARSVASMLETAALYPPVETTDTRSGQTSIGYPTLAGTVRCRLGMPTARELRSAEVQGETVEAIVVVPAATVVGHTWRLIVSGVYHDGGAWAQTYEVVGVDAPRSYEVERRIRVRSLRSGTV